MKKRLLILPLLLSAYFAHAQFWQPTEAAVSTGAITAFVATNNGNTIYYSGNDGAVYNQFSFSSDQGSSWINVGSVLEQGTVGQYASVGNRLYAAVSLVQGDYEYHFSIDNGANWQVDTIGLPHFYGNMAFAKDAFRLKRLGENHLVAFNGGVINGAYIKNINEMGWHETSSSEYLSHMDFTYMGNTWYALNPPYSATPFTQSTDNGTTWTNVAMSGLPEGFVPSMLESNHTDKLYLASAQSDEIYYSTDGGSTWVQSNAGEVYDYGTAWVTKLYAVDDYVFASLYPEDSFNDVYPRYISSSNETPDFTEGDVTGLTESIFVFPILNCFHSGSKFFVMWDDLYSSEPGFSGVSNIEELSTTTLLTYPNPASNALRFETSTAGTWELHSITGKLVDTGNGTPGVNRIDISSLSEGIYTLSINGLTNKVVIHK